MITCPLCGEDLRYIEGEWWRCPACTYLHSDRQRQREPVQSRPPVAVICRDCGLVFEHAAHPPPPERCPRCRRSRRTVVVAAWKRIHRTGICAVCGRITSRPWCVSCRRCHLIRLHTTDHKLTAEMESRS